jgi:muramoyltetrapeptide carboxypeptidase
MDIPTLFPRALRPGDTVGIIAPAGPVQERDAISPALTMLESWGFRVRFDDRIFNSFRYLAGHDTARAEELMRSFEDPSIQGIIALRGGFGCARLIPLLDERRLRHNCKVFMGFSDLTTLHVYFRRIMGRGIRRGMAGRRMPVNPHRKPGNELRVQERRQDSLP